MFAKPKPSPKAALDDSPLSPRSRKVAKSGRLKDILPPVQSKSPAKPKTSAIARALAEQPDGVDVAALAALELEHTEFRKLRDMPIAEAPFLPALVTQAELQQLHEDGIALSRRYNELGMSCLGASSDVALECLQRALSIAPKTSEMVATSLSNLGVCCSHRGERAASMRHLLKAARSDGRMPSAFRARIRLNLCAALNAQGAHADALIHAEDAAAQLDVEIVRAAQGSTYQGSRDDDDEAAAEEGARVTEAVEELAALRAVALHNCCACHEFLGQYTAALTQARRALRLAEKALPEGDSLLERLRSVEEAVSGRQREQLVRAGKPADGSWDARLSASDGDLHGKSKGKGRALAAVGSSPPPRRALRRRDTTTLVAALMQPTAAARAAAVAKLPPLPPPPPARKPLRASPAADRMPASPPKGRSSRSSLSPLKATPSKKQQQQQRKAPPSRTPTKPLSTSPSVPLPSKPPTKPGAADRAALADAMAFPERLQPLVKVQATARGKIARNEVRRRRDAHAKDAQAAGGGTAPAAAPAAAPLAHLHDRLEEGRMLTAAEMAELRAQAETAGGAAAAPPPLAHLQERLEEGRMLTEAEMAELRAAA